MHTLMPDIVLGRKDTEIKGNEHIICRRDRPGKKLLKLCDKCSQSSKHGV